MRTTKPLKLGVLCKVFEQDNECYFVPTILVHFPFEEIPRLLTEMSLWKFVADELGKDAMLDACMPKLRSELLVTGKCFAAQGSLATASAVRVKIGRIDKTLYVIGDRTWSRGAPTNPEPFNEMPIVYERAFGGEGYAMNPVGRGYAPVRTDKGEVHPLPNIEDPKQLIRAPKDRPPPSGLGAYDIMWPQRFSKAGTYDEKWLKDLFPGFAADTDLAMFNAAPLDQQFDGAWSGEEAFSFENMHPTKKVIEGRLPGVLARCFITQKTPAGEVFREIEMRLDTVHMFPHAERGILLFRGLTKIAEDDGADVLHLVAACELIDKPKPVDHYKDALAKRLDPQTGVMHLLRDSDLMPDLPRAEGVPEEKLSDMEDLLAKENLLEKNARRGVEKKLEAAREELRKHGLDPAPLVPSLPPEQKAPKVDELPEFLEAELARAVKEKEDADKKRQQAEKEAREQCAKHGLDYDQLVDAAKKKAGGPPKFSAKAELDKLRDQAVLAKNAGVPLPHVEAMLADGELEKKLLMLEEKLRDAYRRFAHHFPASPALEGDFAAQLRREALDARSTGQSLAGRDFTGADFSGLDLKGVDLKGAMLESASLKGSDLSGADLSGAVLYNADLSEADLSNAKLPGANLGAAKLNKAKVAGGVDLTGAVLAKADLTGANLSGALLKDADLSEVIIGGADFSGAKATNLLFMNTDLSGMKAHGADFSSCNFLDTKVEGADFTGAKLVSSVFLAAKGDKAVFRGATLENLRLVKEASFAGADFQGAMLVQANLRGTNLAGSNFAGADLTGADLSECDLRGASLKRVNAVDSRFAKADLSNADLSGANLMQSILQKAKIYGANLEGANLFRADAAKVRGDKATNFKGANMKQVRVVAAKEIDGQG